MPPQQRDILQNGLVHALRQADDIEPGKATAWFYRLLRNAIIDHYRSRTADRRRKENVATTIAALEEDIAPAPEPETKLCGCLEGVVATMPRNQAELLRRVDLAGMAVTEAARELGITPNNASATLHRARKELRMRLEKFCGACADGACLDCDCDPA